MGTPADNSKSNREQTEFLRREMPQHRVRLTQAFAIGRYEVTQEQWQAVLHTNPSSFKGTGLPVTNVSWYDVHEFIRQLQKLDSQHQYRLPTEAEWEYACRAGSTGNFAGEQYQPPATTNKPARTNNEKSSPTPVTGEDLAQNLLRFGWYEANAFNRPHPAGRLAPNAWGLFDLHGNVSEWCHDWYDPKFYKSTEAENPAGPATGTARIHRGGNWQSSAFLCRSAARSYDPPNERNNFIGFRLVRIKKKPG